MTVDRDQLYIELDKLSADEIEAGLDAGVWSGKGVNLLSIISTSCR
jgi:hypothetical protein